MALLPAVSELLLPISAPAQTHGTGQRAAVVERRASEAGDPRLRALDDRPHRSPNYVRAEDRVAVFDQDGTLWVEQPMYTQVVYCLERVPAVVAKKPELKTVEPFKTVLSGNREAMAKLPMRDLEKILAATLTGMTVDEFRAEATNGSKRPGIRAGSAPIPSSSISRCSRSSVTCATTATRPTS